MVFVIGEAGVNHDGKAERALELVDIAIDAGCDAVKFQTWITEEIILPGTSLAPYQTNNLISDQFELLKQLEVSQSSFSTIKKYCDDKGILFLSTPDDELSLTFLVEELDLQTVKIGSGELTNPRFLHCVSRLPVHVILSTGMGNLGDIQEALKILESGNNVRSITLLQCTTAYPCPDEELHLASMQTIQSTFGLPVGFSDHSDGTVAAVCAVALGATIIEKHFTYDVEANGPDHKASLGPNELKEYVQNIRTATVMMGNKRKEIRDIERENAAVVQKKLFSKKNIEIGQIIGPNDLQCLRANVGIPAKYFYSIINRKALDSYAPGEPIKWSEYDFL